MASQIFSTHQRPFQASGNIAILEVLGPILDSKTTIEQLQDVKKDEKTKAVILRVDSPGGSVGASQEIFDQVRELKKTKPVVVSMGSVAASGGYYVSAPATKIIANAGTITGSIGVRMELVNVEDLLQWAKVKPLTLKSGVLKDAGSPTRAMTPEEQSYLEAVLKKMHEQFKKSVAESRGLTTEEVDAVADGRVLTGEEAREKKLIDDIGNLDHAIQVAGQLAGVDPEPYYPEGKESSFFGWLDHVKGKTQALARTFLFDELSKAFAKPAFFYY